MKPTNPRLVKEALLSALDREEIASRFLRDSYFRPYRKHQRDQDEEASFAKGNDPKPLLSLADIFNRLA
jgi:hypothetical protein